MATEQWRPVPGFPNYQVSDRGRVRNLRPGRPLALVRGRRGYLAVNLYARGRPHHRLVHRLVALAFLGPIPPGFQVNHVNGRKADNGVENLEIVTAEENLRHARESGLLAVSRGEANPSARLTEADVRAIRRLREQGVTARKVALQFGVTEKTVYAVQHRRAWRHVE